MSGQFAEDQISLKAWVETINTDGGIKLHVHGHVEVADETLLYQLERRIEQGALAEELFLVIQPEPAPGNNKIAIKYHENLENKHRYKKVSILTKTGQVFEAKEISIND